MSIATTPKLIYEAAKKKSKKEAIAHAFGVKDNAVSGYHYQLLAKYFLHLGLMGAWERRDYQVTEEQERRIIRLTTPPPEHLFRCPRCGKGLSANKSIIRQCDCCKAWLNITLGENIISVDWEINN